jgi:hypothetical protein
MVALSRLVKCVRVIALALACVTAFASAFAAPSQPGPQEFIEAIYQKYLGEGAEGAAITEPATIRRYFTPAVAAALIKDQTVASKRGEVGALDGDPFIDAQDWKIADLKVAVMPAGAKANATVTFTNFGDRRSVGLSLVKTTAGWRVDDIKASFGSLRKLLKVK